MKNDKGVALAFTVMIMLLVFAISMLVTTLMLAQATYSKSYVKTLEQQRICSQIGDIFYASNGDYTVNEQSSLNSPFALALLDAGFSVDSEWQIEIDGITLAATFSATQDGSSRVKTLTLTNQDVIFTVSARINNDGSKQILRWQRSE